MAKNLVIVESPSKGKTIGRYLGDDFELAASVGHIRDLPSNTMGVDIKNNFKPRYVTMKGKHKVIKDLKKRAEDKDKIYLATDPDREGEAIAWHLAKVLKIDPDSNCRVSFNEITENVVKEAIKKPRTIDMDLVDAQQARRILDRLVGYELSPLLWKKIRKGLSAGRVQSVTTKILVDKEREIEAFVPDEYWHIDVDLHKVDDKELFSVRYYGELEGEKINKTKVENEEQSTSIVDSLKDDDFTVYSIEKGKRQRKPKAPYTTSTLQQDANNRLNFNSRRTMSVAQSLYEGVNISGHGQTSLITYMRTDSVRSSKEAVNYARNYIKKEYGQNYLTKKPRVYHDKKGEPIQDAHEAIRPVHFDLDPQSINKSLNRDQYKLYKLIWERYIASQMKNALIDTVTINIDNNNHIFRTKGETVRFNGYMASYSEYQGKNSKNKIPELSEGEKLIEEKINPQQKFTNPPARYTEASLIKTMEENGIGRPSTYAPTISTILNRHYAEKDRRSLVPTKLGKIVTELLEEHFPYIVDVNFTAKMEDNLDKVEAGKVEGEKVLEEFYPKFHADIEKAEDKIEKFEFPEKKVGEKCPKCGEGDLVYKIGRYGKFIGCSRFPDCDYTESINYDTGRHCPKCGSSVVSMKSKKNRIFYVCDKKGKDPNCDFISWDLPVDGKTCDVCGSYMLERQRKTKDNYIYCSNKDCPTRKKNKRKKKGKKKSKK